MKNLIFTLLTFAASLAFAHGEDKLGPNGGFVRMPGAYHTEIVPVANKEIKVYLLDINWQNPSTKNSSVEISLDANSKNPTTCKVKENYFLCELPKGTNLNKKGQLQVASQREAQKGNLATYPLPLKLTPAPTKTSDEHAGHH